MVVVLLVRVVVVMEASAFAGLALSTSTVMGLMWRRMCFWWSEREKKEVEVRVRYGVNFWYVFVFVCLVFEEEV